MTTDTQRTISIGSRKLGRGQPCYLIAEVGTTSLGDIDMALRLVQAAADAGMDAVKFQLIDPEQVSDPTATYPIVVDGKEQRVNMKEMFSRLRFSEAQWQRIAAACRARRVDFFATVDFIAGVELLERLGAPVHKIGAWDGTYRQLIEAIGRTRKPMLVDLGPTTEAEIDAMVAWYRGAGGADVLFLHDFHTDQDRQMNLRAISYLERKYGWPVGFSSPALDIDLDVSALTLGAAFIEKRLILDRRQSAFHAHESSEPAELKAWVARMRHVERALGEEAVRPSDKDLAGAKLYYRSLCTLAAVRKGDAFTEKNIGAKRPGSGLPTDLMEKVLGRKAKRDLKADTLITREDFE
jgi:sialic acid synthase SpsE